jgi:peptide/nickel transport system substrate-binding protein
MIVRPGHLDGGNFDGYSNAQVDTLTSQALTTTDEGKRTALYKEIQRRLVTDQPDIFLYWTSHLSLAVSNLHGYEANPFRPGVTWNADQWTLG